MYDLPDAVLVLSFYLPDLFMRLLLPTQPSPVPADTSLDLLGSGKLVLDAGDSLKVLASTAGDIEFFASYLEITD